MPSFRGRATLHGVTNAEHTAVIADLWADETAVTWGGILYAAGEPFDAWVHADRVLRLTLAGGAVGTVLVRQQRRKQRATMLEVTGTSVAPFTAVGGLHAAARGPLR